MRRLVVPLMFCAITGLAPAAFADDEVPEPAPEAPAPPATDPPELDARYDEALTAFATGRFGDAAAAFEDVAARSVDPARQTTAAEMARQSEARIVTVSPPAEAPIEAPAVAPIAEAAIDDPEKPRSRDGRYMLLGGVGVLGLGLYGPTMLAAADSSDSKAAVGLYMLGAGGSFLGGYLITRNQPVTWGVTDAWIYGATRGAGHGLAALGLVEGEDVDDDEILPSMALASLAEGTAAAAWAHRTHATSGVTNAIGKAADFGGLFGMGLAYTILSDEDFTTRAVSGAALVGSGVGVAVGYHYAKRRDLTWGDGEVMRSAAALGAGVAVVPLVLGEVENDRLMMGALMGGGALGLLAGDHLLASRDFSPGQGMVMELSPIAGGLVGAGLGYLIAPFDNNNNDGTTDTTSEKVVALGAALGGLGGFALAYYGLDTKVAAPDSPAVTFQLVPTLSPREQGLAVAGTF